MMDVVAQYGLQFTTITAGGMALAQWAVIPFGTAGSTRKRYNCLFYCVLLGELGVVSDLVTMPSDIWYKQFVGVVVMAIVSTGAAHLAVAAKRSMGKK